MKRSVLMECASIILCAAAFSACTWMPEETGDEPLAQISMSFVKTKAQADLDTNSFILTVRDASGGASIYEGPYGSRPSKLEVPAGVYDISVVSAVFKAPAFDSPQYGQELTVSVAAGENAAVAFVCRMMNSGLTVSFTDNFRKKFPEGPLTLSQAGAALDYGYSENRTAFFKASSVDFICGGQTLFTKELSAAQIRRLTLDASDSSASPSFSITVDTSCEEYEERITVGDGNGSGNGLSAVTAYNVAAAVNHPGDTAWVCGYVVGGDLSTGKVTFSGPFTKQTNLAIADSPAETESSRCFSVELSRTAVKNALNLVDNPSVQGKKVALKGVISTYFGLPGLKSVSEFEVY